MALEIDFMRSYDRESIGRELRRIAAVTGKPTVTARDIDAHGRMCNRTVMVKFGSLRAANVAAGLVPSRMRRWPTEELVKMLADLWGTTLAEKERSPKLSDLTTYGMPFSRFVVTKRFGSWRNALVAAAEASDPGTTARSELAASRLAISASVRFGVFKRDLYRCRICQRAGVELELDHIIPVSRGGSSAIENLQTLCVPCNRGKSGSLQ